MNDVTDVGEVSEENITIQSGPLQALVNEVTGEVIIQCNPKEGLTNSNMEAVHQVKKETEATFTAGNCNDLNIGEIKKKLVTELGNLENDAGKDFAVSGIKSDVPPAGLVIDGVGPIGLPLTAHQAKEVIAVCEQAPYGKGEQTVVDTSVRQTWQLNPKNFALENRSFNERVANITKKVSHAMGVRGDVRFSLYKLLLYTEGGHFKPHQDTEKENGMFGTLVIQLPSVYEGGETIVHFKDEIHTVKYDPQSMYSTSYCAFYSDCKHEVKEVTKGYRLVLVYNLCWSGTGNFPSLIKNNKSLEYAELLRAYDVKTGGAKMGWLLEHEYSENALNKGGAARMKGDDRAVVETLLEANQRLEGNQRYNFFLVKAKREVVLTGYFPSDRYGDSDDEFHESQRQEKESLNEIIDLTDSGFELSSNINIIDVCKDLINFSGRNEFFFWGEPDDSFEPTASGISWSEVRAEKLLWYSKYLLIGIPVRKTYGLFCDSDIKSALTYGHDMIGYMIEVGNQSKAVELLTSLVESIGKQKWQFDNNKCIKHILKSTVDNDCIKPILKDLVVLDCNDLAVSFVKNVLGTPYLEPLLYQGYHRKIQCIAFSNGEYFEELYLFLRHFGFDILNESLRQLIKNTKLADKLGIIAAIITSRSLLELKNKMSEDNDKQYVVKQGDDDILLDQHPCLKDLAEEVLKSFSAFILRKGEKDNESKKTALHLVDLIFRFDILSSSSVEKVLDRCTNVLRTEIANGGPYKKMAVNALILKEALLLQNSDTWIQTLVRDCKFQDEMQWLGIVALVGIKLFQKTKTGEPPLTWRQPTAKFHDNKDIEEFLKGPKPSIEINISFGGIQDARLFCSKHFDAYNSKLHPDGFMVTGTARGAGKRCHVFLTKEKGYHQRIVDQYKVDVLLIKDIKMLYPQVVIEPGSVPQPELKRLATEAAAFEPKRKILRPVENHQL